MSPRTSAINKGINTELGQKLKGYRARANMTVREVAQALGCPQSTYSTYEDKLRSDGLPPHVVNKLSEIWADIISPEELMELIGLKIKPSSDSSTTTKKIDRVTNQEPLPPLVKFAEMPRNIPVRGCVLSGVDGVFDLSEETVDYARRPPRLEGITTAFAVYLCSDTMSPWRETGELVYVQPAIPVSPMDYVLVRLREVPGYKAPCYIKRFVAKTEKEVRLLQFNPRKEITVPMADIVAMHKVLNWTELLNL